MFSFHRRQSSLLLVGYLIIFSTGMVSAQPPASGDLELKKLPDSIMGHRTLIVPDPFNATTALRRLFPGKWYHLRFKTGSNDRLISWVCPACKRAVYVDANKEEPSTIQFPFPDGVATRLINVFSYADSMGIRYKLISFNHSYYDHDCRFFNQPSACMAHFLRPPFRYPSGLGMISTAI